MFQDKYIVQLVETDGHAVLVIGDHRDVGGAPEEIGLIGILRVGHLPQVARNHVHDGASGVGDGILFDAGLEGLLRLDQHCRQAQDNEREHGRGNEHLQNGQARPSTRGVDFSSNI